MGDPLSGVESEPGDLDFCYLTTRGRVTGRPHRIEIWFALEGEHLYFLAGDGERSDWVRNVIADPRVSVELGARTRAATARVVTDPAEDELARRLLVEKYQPRDADDLTGWGRSALPIALTWSTETDS